MKYQSAIKTAPFISEEQYWEGDYYMPLDAVCLSAVVCELKVKLCGLRVDRVFQPERDEVILTLRSNAGVLKLLISASPNHARIHLTGAQRENPESPPMFCMLLRKHLLGARIRDITQPPLERAVDIVFDATDEMGNETEKTLTAEVMGKHSNIILRGADGRIIDCVRRVDADMSIKRQVLPGLFYRLPPAQEKLSFLDTDMGTVVSSFHEAPQEKTLEKWLLESFFGLSPLICRELAYRVAGNTGARIFELGSDGEKRFIKAFESLRNDVNEKRFTPYLLLDGDKPFDFSYTGINQYEIRMKLEKAESFSELLESFYAVRDELERNVKRSQELVKLVTNARDRVSRRLAVQMEEYKAAQDRDRLRETGDIISANIYSIQKGTDRARLVDFFDPEGGEVEIALDSRLSPQQNAASYYKKYTRAKNAEEKLKEQLKQGQIELDYLESVLEELSRCSSSRDLYDVRQELSENGYIARQRSEPKKKGKIFEPLTFRSSAGIHIYAGRNNKQNDILTMKFASKRDVWLHVHKIHGCHVIIDCSKGQPDDSTLTEAAEIAAYYSQGKNSQNVPVDYTQVKNVKKPPGAKHGMVTYDQYKTAFVTPAAAEVLSRLEKK